MARAPCSSGTNWELGSGPPGPGGSRRESAAWARDARLQADRTISNRLQLDGYTILRFTHTDVARRPAHVARQILAALATAGAAAHLFKPADAIILPPATDDGTPTQKDEPMAENPPIGAVIAGRPEAEEAATQ